MRALAGFYVVHRRRVLVSGDATVPHRQRLAGSWKLRTLVLDCRTIAQARAQAAALRQYPNEDQQVRRCDRHVAEWARGHQVERKPAGVGLL